MVVGASSELWSPSKWPTLPLHGLVRVTKGAKAAKTRILQFPVPHSSVNRGKQELGSVALLSGTSLLKTLLHQ